MSGSYPQNTFCYFAVVQINSCFYNLTRGKWKGETSSLNFVKKFVHTESVVYFIQIR